MPPPEINSARQAASRERGYSIPLPPKKAGQCTPMIAVSIVQAIRKAPTRVRNPKSSSAPPISSASAAAPIHNQAGRIKGNGAGKLVNFAKPGPPKLPNTFCAPCPMKIAASARRSGKGVQDAVVEIIFLNIAVPLAPMSAKAFQIVPSEQPNGNAIEN